MKIILLSGKQGAGKTTIAQALADAWISKPAHKVAVMKFAEPLYWMHDAVLEVLSDFWPDRGLKKDGPLLQLLGTEWGRKTIDENVWVKILQNRIEKEKSDFGYRETAHKRLIIIEDCRFENEFDAFPEALRIRLRAEEGCRKKRCEMWRENVNHPSEIGLDNYNVQGKFDMFLNTDDWTLENCLEKVLLKLDENDWISKRK